MYIRTDATLNKPHITVKRAQWLFLLKTWFFIETGRQTQGICYFYGESNTLLYMTNEVQPNSKKEWLKNMGRIFLWFLQMLGILCLAIILTAIFPAYKNYIYFGVFILFIFLRAVMVRRMRARVDKEINISV